MEINANFLYWNWNKQMFIEMLCRSLLVYFFLSGTWHLFISKKACKTRNCGLLGLRCDINLKSLLWLCNKSAVIHHIFSGAHYIYWVVNEDFLTFQFYRFEIQSNCPWCSLGPYVVNALHKDHKVLVFIYETSGISYWWNLWSCFIALSASHASCYIYAVRIQFLVLWCT